jgi:hypothetical protein
MKNTIITLMGMLIVTVLVMSGCTKLEPSPTTLSATEVFNKSSENFQAVNSFHFVLDQGGGGTPITGGIDMTGAAGDIVRPDNLQMTISGTAMGMSLEVQLVTVGEKTYMTNPLNGKWEVPPDQFKVLSVFDPDTGIAAIMKGVTGSTQLSDETVASTLCYHLKGNVVSDALRPLTGDAVAGAVISTEVWVGKEDFMVRQIKLVGKITEGEKEGIVRTLALSNFNQEVIIKLPV